MIKRLPARTVHQAWLMQLRVRARVQRHGLVLMYHRIGEPSSDPWDMAVSAKHFGEHLDVVRRYGDCLPLGRFADRLASADRPRRIIAITFDDGYRDNYLAGAPALEARDMPATIFVVSGKVGAGNGFWWDRLVQIFLTTAVLPDTLVLDIGATPNVWNLGTASHCTAAEIDRIARWRAQEEAPWHLRQSSFLGVWRVLNDLPAAEADRLCAQVAQWAGTSAAIPAADQTMTHQDIARLASGGLIEIGGHTVTHRRLDLADPAEAAREIASCRAQLGEMAGREILSFSYPFGRLNPRTPELVRAAGFTCACESWNWRLLAYPGTDRFKIPRLTIPDMDGDQFAAFLQEHVGR